MISATKRLCDVLSSLVPVSSPVGLESVTISVLVSKCVPVSICVPVSRCVLVSRFFHSFILETYIAPLQETTTQRGSQPMQSRTKKEGLQRDVKFGRVGHQQGTQLKGEIIPC